MEASIAMKIRKYFLRGENLYSALVHAERGTVVVFTHRNIVENTKKRSCHHTRITYSIYPTANILLGDAQQAKPGTKWRKRNKMEKRFFWLFKRDFKY